MIVRTYDFTSKEDGQRYKAELKIDEHWLLQQLASRAMRSKGKKAKTANGAVEVKVCWVDPETTKL